MQTDYGNSFPAFVPTSMIGVPAVRDAGRLSADAYLFFNNEGVEQLVYATTIRPCNGLFALHGLKDLLEEDLRDRGISSAGYVLEIAGERLNFSTLFCSLWTNATNCHEKFLSSLSSQRAFRDSLITVAAVPNDDPLVAEALFVSKSYRPVRDNFELAPNFRSGAFSVNLADFSPTAEAPDAKLAAVSLTNGNRRKTWYVADGAPDASFIFRNCFNAFDCLQLKADVSRKPKAGCSLAKAGGRLIPYDFSFEESFEAATGPLVHNELAAVSQLVSSKEILASIDGKNFFPATITESDCAFSRKKGAANSAKISWRFLSSRPALFANDDKGRIFSIQHSPEFS